MPAAPLVAGSLVRGKTKAVLNKKGIIQSVNGNQYFILWSGTTQPQMCTKHAFQVWVEGEEVQPRGFVRRSDVAAPPPAPDGSESGQSERGSERGDDAGEGDNAELPGDLSDDGGDEAAAGEVRQPEGAVDGQVSEAGAIAAEEQAGVNIVQPNIVRVDRTSGQRVLESRSWLEQEVTIALETERQVWSRPPKLNWNKNRYTAGVEAGSPKTALQYYMLFQCPESLDIEVQCTNRNLRARPNEPAAATSLSVPELLRKRGIRLSMVLEPLRGGSVADYWSSTCFPGTFQQPRSYGKRMGMSKHRFEVLESCMQLCEQDDTDRWWPIRKLLERFNAHMKVVFVAGKWVVIDESGFWWLGKDGQWCHDGMPHVTKIARKPRSVMAELKSLCDALTGIMIAVELQEGKDAMKTKEFAAPPDSMPHHVALNLRLTKLAGLHGTGRVLVGDSYFSSVNALLRLHEFGLFFWGIVKTATALYPMRVLKDKSAAFDAPNRRENRGKHNTFTSEYEVAGQRHKMAAIAWHDLKTKYIITNVGHTLPGAPLVRRRTVLEPAQNAQQAALCTTREVHINIPQPAAVADGFEHFSAVDMHNDYRQGILKIEEYYKTHSWWKRMAASLEGLRVVNAYLAYKFEVEQRLQEPEDYFTFCHRLAYQLVHNPYLPSGRQRHRTGSDEDFVGVAGVCEVRALSAVVQVDWQNANKKNPRKRCRECSQQCSHVCIGCSNANAGTFFFICNPSRKPKCFADHVQHMLAGDDEQ